MTHGRIIILTNSHSRSFIGYNNVYPVYLGPASNVNITNGINILLQNVEKFFKKMKYLPTDRIILLFGEGSIRYDLKKTLYPHVVQIKKWEVVYKDDIMRRYQPEYYDILVNNYYKVYKLCQNYCSDVYVMSSVSAFYPIINKILDFNQILSSKYGDKFIDIYSNLIVFNEDIGQYRIKDEYLNKNFKNETEHNVYKNFEYDPIHLNKMVLNKQMLIDHLCIYSGCITKLQGLKNHDKFKVIII